MRRLPCSDHQLRPSLLRISSKFEARSRAILVSTWMGLPLSCGDSIRVAVLPELTAYRGKLLTAQSRGSPVHAATFIRQRKIILETALLASADRLRLIFAHEVFHFVWVRFANSSRRVFSELLSTEIGKGARGEIGESSGVKKAQVLARHPHSQNSALWRDYVCESFCDSAAAFLSGAKKIDDSTLAKSWTALRRRWLLDHAGQGWRF